MRFRPLASAIFLLFLLTSCDQGPAEPVSYDELGWKANVYSLNDKPFTGVALQTHSDGSTKGRWEFKKGVPHGVVSEFDEAGTKIAETHYKGGIRHGDNTYWDAAGTKIKLQVYADGEEVSVEYHGSLAEEAAKGTK